MNNNDKITLSITRLRSLVFLVLFIFFDIVGVVLYTIISVEGSLFDRLLILASTIFFIILSIYFLWGVFRAHASVIIDFNGIEIKTSSKEKFMIPWNEIKKIGIQAAFIAISEERLYGYDTFLAFCFKNPEKYNNLKIKFGDKELIKTPESFKSYMGEKADIYVFLNPWLNNKHVMQFIDYLRKKPFTNFTKFPPLIKTNDKNLYEKFIQK